MKQKTPTLLCRGLTLMLSASILLGLTACGKRNTETTPPEAPVATQDATAYTDGYQENINDENEATVPTTMPIISFSELVTDAFADVRMMKYGSIRCFHIPQINAEVCAEANEKIFDAEMNVLTEGFYDHWDSGIYKTFDFEFDPGLGSLGYLYGEKNGVVSILMCRGGTEFGSYYETYYVSTQSGEMLPMINMLEAYGMSEDKWKEKAEETLQKYWTEFAGFYADFGESTVEEMRKWTFSEENLADIKPFLLEDGSLAMIATIFTPVGDGAMTVVLNVENGEEFYPVFCGEEHTEFTQEELITVDDATELAAQYWGFESVADLKKDGDLFIRYDDYTKQRVDGVLYYVIYLQGFVEIENEHEGSEESTDPTETTEAPYVHLSTIDYVFVHTATGEIVIPEY